MLQFFIFHYSVEEVFLVTFNLEENINFSLIFCYISSSSEQEKLFITLFLGNGHILRWNCSILLTNIFLLTGEILYHKFPHYAISDMLSIIGMAIVRVPVFLVKINLSWCAIHMNLFFWLLQEIQTKGI